MKHCNARRRAFTLIEILVVIAIILLLAGLLFPVFGRVREEGRKTSCLSNMKQLGLAFEQYTQDSRGKYPLSGDFYDATTGTCFGAMCDGWRPGNGHWVAGPPNQPIAHVLPATGTVGEPNGNSANLEAGALFPYIKSTAVYVCPSNKDGEVKHLTYSMNCALTALSVSRIRSPGDIVLLVDEEKANDGYFFAVNDGPAGSTAAGTTSNSTDALTIRHNGGGNLLFADGHVKFFSAESFPLDGTPEGKANKWKTSGSPRFHDRAFGQWGSSKPAPSTPPNPNIITDYCNATAGPGSADGMS